MLARQKLVWLNAANDGGKIQQQIVESLLTEFPKDLLIGLEIGSAYGGGVEFMAKMWFDRGKVYGYDTFKGHPRDLAASPTDLEATCMDMWYEGGEEWPVLGIDKLTYGYQRKVLDEELLTNAILVKGRVNKHSFDDIKKIHLAMIDLDLIKPTIVAYNAIKYKFVKGGYLLIHDALPPDHLPKIFDFVYHKILEDGRWDLVLESNEGNLTVLKRK